MAACEALLTGIDGTVMFFLAFSSGMVLIGVTVRFFLSRWVVAGFEVSAVEAAVLVVVVDASNGSTFALRKTTLSVKGWFLALSPWGSCISCGNLDPVSIGSRDCITGANSIGKNI